MPLTLRRVPGTYTSVDSSRAQRGPAVKDFRALLIGGKTSAGTLPQKTKALVTSADQVRALAGNGSQLHGMALAWFAAEARPLKLEILALDDSGSGVAASTTLSVSTTTVLAGTIPLLIAGRRVPVAVAAGDSSNAIASAIRAAVNLVDGLPVAATGSAQNVILTAKNAGVEGNSIDLRVAYFDGETLPSGVTLSGAGTLSGGATNPSLDSATFLAMGEVQYDVIACAFADVANLAALSTELESRFGPNRQIQSSAFTSKRDSLANLVTFGTGKNARTITVMGYRSEPACPWERAAAVAAAAGGVSQADPAAPVQYIPLPTLLPPREIDDFTPAEREILLHSGIGTTVTLPGGVVGTERLVTLYQLSDAGAPDTAFLDYETMATLAYLRWDWIRRTKLLHPRSKLKADNVKIESGQEVVTPAIRRAEFAATYREWEAQGLVEDFDGAMRDSTFAIDPADPTAMDENLAPNLVNQGRVFNDVFQFRL